MKNIHINICGWILLCGLLGTSCQKDLLEKNPVTSLPEASYWSTVNDLKLYCNSFYQQLPSYTGFATMGIYSLDNNSDNLVPGSYNTRLNGEDLVTPTSDNWSYAAWKNIRDVNYFLVNYNHVKDSWDNIKPYVGEAYYFRAWFYFDMLKKFGDLPWVNQPLMVTDTAFLTQPRLSRSVIVDSIAADLDKASSYLNSQTDAGAMRVYKELAFALKARICLYEGTWEKYHANDAFGVKGQDGKHFLELAAAAADSVMRSGLFALDNMNDPYSGYWKIFNQVDYTPSKEVMFWRKYSISDGVSHNWNRYLNSGANTGLSKRLVDAYLCTDGNPIAVSQLYQGDDSLQQIVRNRDPRLRQTIYVPGDTITNNVSPVQLFKAPTIDQAGEGRSTTGFQLYKGRNPDYNQSSGGDVGTDGLIYFRYAEVLLNYAEAKAELGDLTQADVDQSINLLRDRVHMPHLNIAGITIDPNWQFPNLSPVINEVRRERQVELSCEGFRFDDICRWAAAAQLIVGYKPSGAKFNQWRSVFPNLSIGKDIFVNEKGYLAPYLHVSTMSGGYKFNPERDYLMPLPTQELNLAHYKQNPGW